MSAGVLQPWSPGAHIVIRGLWRGRVWTARPVTVVRDAPELIVLYVMPGTVYKYPRVLDADRVPDTMPDAPWRLVDHVWHGGGAICLHPPGEPYMAIGFFDDDNAQLRAWYVNLQDPLRRTALGFDFLDQELDIVISPDLADWRWKDEEGFAELQRRGRITPERAAELRAVGARVIEHRRAADSLFQQGWERWSPPVGWRVPHLPPGWEATEWRSGTPEHVTGTS